MKKTAIEFLYNVVMQRNSINRFWRLRDKALKQHGIFRLMAMYSYYKYLDRFVASIPLSTKIIGKIEFPHGVSGIFISSHATIGSGVIFQQVTIGSVKDSRSKHPGGPIIGDNVLIGAGAKVIGGIHVGNNVKIGANCIVTEDIPDNCTVVMNHPRTIKH